MALFMQNYNITDCVPQSLTWVLNLLLQIFKIEQEKLAKLIFIIS
jgi:hypothetical protein